MSTSSARLSYRRCPYSFRVEPHASTSVRSLQTPVQCDTGSNATVWTHHNTAHTDRNGGAALTAAVDSLTQTRRNEMSQGINWVLLRNKQPLPISWDVSCPFWLKSREWFKSSQALLLIDKQGVIQDKSGPVFDWQVGSDSSQVRPSFWLTNREWIIQVKPGPTFDWQVGSDSSQALPSFSDKWGLIHF